LLTSDASALTTTARDPDAGDHSADGDTEHCQFVSEPLAAQTFTAGDAFDYAIQGFENNANNTLFVRVFIGLVSNDGTSALATLRSKANDDVELDVSAIENRYYAGTLSGGYTCAGGERLVIEFSLSGFPGAGGGVQGHNGSLRWGGDGASGDLPENNTSTSTTSNPWIEFANTITFAAGGFVPFPRPRGLTGGMQTLSGGLT